ncbi:hypothetical protein SteCoe_18694 [Stentor coeruleus]|uniref:non-specific serine/threonine protein kinase n=1 Tax=Stentor coeruleus TaxID=5963 RepID=A0A1R2BVT9_9CILI|nr:hypothetical protein SteCoe_18694 [Stentor coeruleus]
MGCSPYIHDNKHEQDKSLKLFIGSDTTITPGIFTRVVDSSSLHDYNLIRIIGSGAFSKVLLCSYQPTLQLRAIKIMKKSSLVTQQLDTDYKIKEAAILRKFDHPNIIKCFEVFEDSLNYYMPLEYCQGGSVFEKFIVKKELNEEKIRVIMAQLLSAIAYFHEKGVIHRDLKPENIFLESKETSQIKLGDFGSACEIVAGKRCKGCFGTAYYLAPEMIKGSYDEKVDIWSCGIILFILLTGSPPYSGKNTADIKSQILKHPLTSKQCSVVIQNKLIIDFLENILVINPNDRISASKALLHPWIAQFRNNFNIKSEILKNLHQKKCFSKIYQAVSMYIVAYLLDIKDISELKQYFYKIDKNGDGKLDEEEIKMELRTFMDSDKAELTSKEIFKKYDLNSNDFIDYSEFLLMSLSDDKYLLERYISAVFKEFDLDQDGFVTLWDIQSVIGRFSHDALDLCLIKECSKNNKLLSEKKFINIIRKCTSKKNKS